MKIWGHYELASTPADADLVLEIRFTDATVREKTFNGTSIGSVDEPEFRLVILDPKTRMA